MTRSQQETLDQLPPIDKLMARPDETPLHTTLDPAGPEAHGYPADPKPVVKKSAPGNSVAADQTPGDIGRSA